MNDQSFRTGNLDNNSNTIKGVRSTSKNRVASAGNKKNNNNNNNSKVDSNRKIPMSGSNMDGGNRENEYGLGGGNFRNNTSRFESPSKSNFNQNRNPSGPIMNMDLFGSGIRKNESGSS